jgi:hypothetical protein
VQEILARKVQSQFHWTTVYSQVIAELDWRIHSRRKTLEFWETLFSTTAYKRRYARHNDP